MTRHVLIGVGGSGQHVVLAYLRALALTVPPPGAVPHVFILDADAERGTEANKRSRVIDDIAALRGSLLRGEHPDQRPHFEVFKPFRAGRPGRHMMVEHLVGDSAAARRLAHGFLADDEGHWGSEWSVELERGMMANPKIGAMTLAHKVLGAASDGAPSLDDDMAQIFACLGESVLVAVVGSSFGGTGSGAVPALVRVLDKQRVAHVRAFMTLPWFAIEPGSDRARESSAAAVHNGVDPQERNAALGLHTYWDELRGGSGLQRSSYVLSQSMDDWPQVKRRDQGNFDQEEHAHVLNLAQAMAVQAFFGLGSAVGGDARGVLFALRSTSMGERAGQFDAQTSAHLRLWVARDDSRQLYDIAADAEATAMVLERGGRVLTSTNKGKITLPVVKDTLEVRDGLKDCLEALRKATNAKQVDHAGAFAKIMRQPQLMPEDAVFHALGRGLIARANEIRQSLLWLDAHAVAQVDSKHATGITKLPAGHLFKATNPGDFRVGTEPVQDKDALLLVWKGLGVSVAAPSGEDMTRAEVEPQAFAVFTQLFKDGEADDSLVMQFQRALTADPNTAPADLAASLLALAAHRRVVALRSGRFTAAQTDAAQRADGVRGDRSDSPMLRLRVAANQVGDVRLAAIDLAKPAVGEDAPGPFEARHPRSLKYLDPYTEFSSERNDGFSFAKATLPEHGLRGIPSLVAPILLQRWRAGLCRPDANATPGDALRTDDGKGGRRSTQRGIHLHATRINEAALWLLVSADPRVSYVPDLLIDDDSEEAFTALVRHSLAAIGLRQLPALVFSRQQNGRSADVPVFLWGGDTWCLAANQDARRFFAKLVAELPSVRHAFQPDAPLLRLRQGGPRVAFNPLDRFFVTELQALREQFAGRASPVAADVFVDLVTTTLADLPDAPSAEVATLPTEGQRRIAGKTTVARLPTAGPRSTVEIEVHAPAVLARMSEYLLGDANSPVVVVTSRLAAGPGTELVLDTSTVMLPLRGDIWSELEMAGSTVRVKKTANKTAGRKDLARCKISELTLQLAGLGAWRIGQPFGERALRLAERELDWSYSVWPPFTAPGWMYYIVSALCVGSEASDDAVQWRHPDADLSFVVYGLSPADPDGALVPLATVERGLPVRVHGVPVSIELRLGQRPIGSQPILLRPRTAQGKALDRVGIDFGTSNTCVAYKPMRGNIDGSGSEMVPLLPLHEREIVFATSEADAIGARAQFLSNTGNGLRARSAIVKRDEEAATIPSELLIGLHDTVEVARRQMGQLDRVYAAGSKALVDMATQGSLDGRPLASPLFAPLPNRRQGLNEDKHVIAWLANMVTQGEDRLYGDLKWPREGDDTLEPSRQLRSLYLEAVIAVAFAYLREQGYERFASFVATQPEARTSVKDAFPNGYAADLTRVVRELCERTGLRWAGGESQEPAIVSETAAALLMNDLEDPRQPHSALTIDIGGGTTDVGVLLNDGKAPPRGVFDPRRFTASARFAGNQLLRALVGLPMVREALIRDAGGQGEYFDTALVAMLKAKLRNGISIAQHERVQAVSEMFFDATFEYALRVLTQFAQTYPGWIEAFEQAGNERRLQVILLGNGFKLFGRLRVGGDGGEAELQAFLRSRLQRAVAAGMLSERMAAKFDFRLAPNSKSSLIAVGAFNAVEFGEGRFRPGLTDVLVPGCLVTTHNGRHAEPVPAARRVHVDDFSEEWLDRPLGGGAPREELVLMADDETLRQLFPLTLRYWGRDVVPSAMVQQVFKTYAKVAEEYLDIGALYLAGHQRVADAKSFDWLMRQAAS